MSRPSSRTLIGALIGLGLAGGQLAPRATAQDPFLARVPRNEAERRARILGGGVRPEDCVGPHVVDADLFNPDRGLFKPALGGRIINHLASEPANLNYVVENSASTTYMLNEVHAALVRFNWETWQQEPELARSFDIEDTLILKGGRSEGNGNILFGKVEDLGDSYRVTSGSPNNPIEPRVVPKSGVESVQRETVFTFHLKDGVKWHDGHPFDADDVVFSIELYRNPGVDTKGRSFRFLDILKSEKIDRLTCRFFYVKQYFQALQTFNDTLCILPSHLYNLADPDNARYDPHASAEAQATAINDNPHNTEWVGLGPYKVREWVKGQYVEAVRFDDYFETDPSKRGYVDVMRWRFIKDDDAAFQALLNDELDIFERVKSEDYFGAATEQPLFLKKFYKAHTYTGQYGYTGWNMYRSKLSDARVRTALAYAFNEPSWIAYKYSGLAVQVTGPQFFLGPAYNHDVKALPYDPDRAVELLAEAGWYDRNGNGIVDKNGEDLIIEWLMPTGNKASESYGQKMQESYAKIGVKLVIQPYEWATFLQHIYDRDFDACNLAWVIPEIESDPWQLWHSSEAAFEKESSNHCGYKDAASDELIERGRKELDPSKRAEIWKQLHARIYEIQPYLFAQNPPLKFAFKKTLRGVKLYNFSPGFKLRDMYYAEGTPGTRPLSSD